MGSVFLRPQCLTSCLLINDNIHKMKKKKKKNEKSPKAVTFIKSPTFLSIVFIYLAFYTWSYICCILIYLSKDLLA